MGWFSLPWWVYGMAALLLAVVWALVWPSDRLVVNASEGRALLVRWGHALTWLLLAVSFFMRAGWLPGGEGAANLIAMGALLAYFGFLAATFVR